jgi:ribonuclease HII
MAQYAQEHPGYGWESNRGYPTPDHRRALRELGPTPLHRRSFGLVREVLAAAAQPMLFAAE